MTKQETLKIPALHCGSCVETVTRILSALPNVTVTQSDPETKLVTYPVTVDEGRLVIEIGGAEKG